jgi:5-methylcytosine-specific restriction protein B
MVTDVIFRFRLCAIFHGEVGIARWEMEVMTLVEVGRILHTLSFITAHDAYRLGQESTTIVPIEGFQTIPLTLLANVASIVYPEEMEDVSDEAKEGYPPKLVLSLATKYASGSEYDRNLFSGGEKSQAFGLLRGIGFYIERKDFVSELVKRFLEQAVAANDLSTKNYPKSYRGLQVTVSFGKGNFARIPWISFLAPGQTTSNGIYPVYLYYRDANLLILAYGISETSVPASAWAKDNDAQSIQEFLISRTGKAPERYGDSRVFASYPTDTELNDDQLTLDLDMLVENYLTQVTSTPSAEQGVVPEAPEVEQPPITASPTMPFTIDEAVESLFIDRDRFKAMLDLWSRKKNVVLCGPPGVGKTFFSRRLAYALLKEKAPNRVGAVQFHQSYSYEDFVQGYRPSVEGFVRKNGLFYQFCERARDDAERSYVFIIDEINRGNMSKIFGELLMLIEADKRKTDWQTPLDKRERRASAFAGDKTEYRANSL